MNFIPEIHVDQLHAHVELTLYFSLIKLDFQLGILHMYVLNLVIMKSSCEKISCTSIFFCISFVEQLYILHDFVVKLSSLTKPFLGVKTL